MDPRKTMLIFLFGLSVGLLASAIWSSLFVPNKAAFDQVVLNLQKGTIRDGDRVNKVTDLLGKQTVLEYHCTDEGVEYINAVWIRKHQYIEVYTRDQIIFAAKFCAGISQSTSEWYIFNSEIYNEYITKWIE